MTDAQLKFMETRLENLEEHRVEHPLNDETLRLLREWLQELKRRERDKVAEVVRRKIVDINEYRRRSA